MPPVETVEAALKKATETADGKVLVVGYSPTGGGHTARTLNIIHQGLEDGHLKEGDCIVFHAPEVWEGQRRPEVTKLITALKDKGVNIVVARADKSVYGYLNKKTGGSDDRKILKKLSMFPKRGDEHRVRDIKESKLVTEGTELPEDVNGFIYGSSDSGAAKIISAKDLMRSLVSTVGAEKKDKLFLLTDMDPYLQKAAIQEGVPPNNCLDQQNHGVLLGALPDEEGLSHRDMLAEEAFLGKVLAGSGGNIAHIGLGDRNTLKAVDTLATERMGIKADTPVEVVKSQVVDILRAHGNEYGHSGGRTDGVIWPPGLKEGGDVEQIVYVYAHQKTPGIAEHIKAKLGIDPAGEADPNYAKKVFLFCGGKAVKEGYNAMHLAYLAEADGVTTAGAGTTGEFAYLNKAGNQSRLLILPIEGHNEQARNAEKIATSFAEHVTVAATTDGIGAGLDELVSKPAPVHGPAPAMMGNVLAAVARPDTYVKQAADILFNSRVQDMGAEAGKMKRLEEKMRNDPLLKASRHYVKLVFQVFDQIEHNLERYKTAEAEEAPPAAPEDKFMVKFKKEGPEKKWSLEELKEIFSDTEKLYAVIADAPAEHEGAAPELDFGSREAVLVVLDHYKATVEAGVRRDIGADLGQIEDIEEGIGTKMTTGF